MTLAVVSVSAPAGRPASRMQQLAGAQAQECCVCCLNSGLSQCRPEGAEGRKLLRVYIAELSSGPPQCLMHFCSNIHKCGDDPRWCWSSQWCFHPDSPGSFSVGTIKLIAPTVGVCCFNLQAWMIDKKCYKAQFSTLWRLGRAVREVLCTDRWRDRSHLIGLSDHQGARHWHTTESSS